MNYEYFQRFKKQPPKKSIEDLRNELLVLIDLALHLRDRKWFYELTDELLELNKLIEMGESK